MRSHGDQRHNRPSSPPVTMVAVCKRIRSRSARRKGKKEEDESTRLCVDAGCSDNVAVTFTAVRFRAHLARQQLLEVPPFRITSVDERDVAPGSQCQIQIRLLTLRKETREVQTHSSEPPKRQTPPSASL